MLHNFPFLDLDGDLSTILQTSPMNLSNTRTSPSSPLHHTFVRFPSKRNPEDLLGRLAEVLTNDLLHILPVILRRIIEHAREHLLELRRQDSRLHSDCLAHLQIKTPVMT